ncbi:hypothetical protein EMPS_06435 [Entomortierella parvispora]|uniref:Mediator of DNA damage checkpoint protein 1 n=1 Tax=Entomortierella parvispora TaxID=205924 RepID=A0A9P3LXF7_9FUNG|nr:hypothetical protein EMPS_06435 [Entomortierella parvispora]
MPTTDTAKPVLQLRIRKFRDCPETTYPLYPGSNTIGRNPDTSTVWLPMPFISACHCVIDINDVGVAFVRDEPKREDQEPSIIHGMRMQQGCFYEFSVGRILKLAGLVTCLVERLTSECDYRRHIISDRVLKARKTNLYRTKTMGRIASRKDYPEFDQDGLNGLQTSSQCDSTQEHSSIPCTLSAVGQTLSLEDVNHDGEMMDSVIGEDFRSLRIPTRILPSELTVPSSQHVPFDDMCAPTLPYGDMALPHEPIEDESTTPRAETWTEPDRLDATAPIDGFWDTETTAAVPRHDMPTQIFDRNAATLVVANNSLELPDHKAPTPAATKTSAELYDRNAPTQVVSAESYDRNAPTQVVQMYPQLLLDQDTPTQLISGSVSTEVVQQTQLGMDIQSTSQRDSEASSQVVSATQPLHVPNFEAASTTSNQYDSDALTLPVSSTQSSHYLDPDAPTQLLDTNQPTLLLTSSLSSGSEPSLGQNSRDADRVESTQLLAPQGSSLEPSEDNPLSGTIEVPDSLSDGAGSTQPLPTEKLDSAPSAPHSRRGSLEQNSQDRSQVYSMSESERLQQHIRIPSTPVEVINQRQTSPRLEPAVDEYMDDGLDSTKDGDTRDYHGLDVVESTQIPVSQTGPRSGGTSRNLSPDFDMDSSHSSPSRAESPKHDLGIDSGKEDTPKPTKQIKRERTDVSVGSLSNVRPTSRMLQRRATMDIDMNKFAVLFSAPKLEEDDKKRYADIVVRLGGVNKDDYREGTILVHSASSRTYKFMCAIVRCIPIVSLDWIEKSGDIGRFLPWEDFAFYDEAMEKAYNFNLQNTCKMAKDNRANSISLFGGDSFYFITQSGQHRRNKDRSQEGFMSKQYVSTNVAPMVNVCGGKIVAKPPTSPSLEKSNRRLFIVGPDIYCPETQEFIQKGFTVVRKEFILSAILNQAVEIQPHLILPASEPTAEDAIDRNSNAGDDNSRDWTTGTVSNESKRRLTRAGSTSSNIAAADDSEPSLAKASSSKPGRSTAKRPSRAAKVGVESSEGGPSSKGPSGTAKGSLTKSGSTVQGKGRGSKR